MVMMMMMIILLNTTHAISKMFVIRGEGGRALLPLCIVTRFPVFKPLGNCWNEN